MKKKGGGLREAASMINALSAKEQQRILDEMSKLDPDVTKAILDRLVTINDLKYLTQNMIRDFLKEISLQTLGLAFRACPQETIDHVLKNISQNMQEEVEETWRGPPVQVSLVQEAQDKIISKLKEKIEKGEIIIDRSGKEKLV